MELFEGAGIGGMEVRNRFVRSATWTGMAGGDGEVTGPLIDLYRALSKGGVGLILTGYAFVTKRGKASPGMLGADEDTLIPGLKSLTSAIHEEGGRIALQIVHGGSQSNFDTGMPTEAPAAVKERATGNMPVEMTVDDIKRVVRELTWKARGAGERL